MVEAAQNHRISHVLLTEWVLQGCFRGLFRGDVGKIRGVVDDVWASSGCRPGKDMWKDYVGLKRNEPVRQLEDALSREWVLPSRQNGLSNSWSQRSLFE